MQRRGHSVEARRARAEPAGAEATAQAVKHETSGTWLPVTQRLATEGRADLGKPAVHVLQGTVKGLGRWEGWEEVTNMACRPPGDRVGAELGPFAEMDVVQT